MAATDLLNNGGADSSGDTPVPVLMCCVRDSSTGKFMANGDGIWIAGHILDEQNSTAETTLPAVTMWQTVHHQETTPASKPEPTVSRHRRRALQLAASVVGVHLLEGAVDNDIQLLGSSVAMSQWHRQQVFVAVVNCDTAGLAGVSLTEAVHGTTICEQHAHRMLCLHAPLAPPSVPALYDLSVWCPSSTGLMYGGVVCAAAAVAGVVHRST